MGPWRENVYCKQQTQTSLHSLIITFVIPFFESSISKLATGEISIYSYSLWLRRLVWVSLSQKPKDRFCHVEAQLIICPFASQEGFQDLHEDKPEKKKQKAGILQGKVK